MSFIAMIVLLGAATSLLFQSATAQAVVFPYNCNSTVPICQTDCVTAVNNICSGSVGQLTTELNTTVNGCTAKYIPYNSVADTKATCLANFQKILAASDAAASTCDGKTPTRIGGVLAMDANNNFVPSTSYAIFPASNNPNCVVNPSQISAPVAAKDNLLGTIYNCASDTGTSVAAPATINTRGWQCPVSITSAALCSSACVLGVFFT